MGKRHGRLSPDEVKAQMAAEKGAEPAPAFNSPFAAAAGELQKLVPKKATAAQRLRARAATKPKEPTPLAEARRRHKAEREAIAEQTRPILRPGARKTDE